jgi:hypothetical protein
VYTDHLKTTLEGIASLRGEIAAIDARHAKSASGSPCYPSMCGALQATIGFAADQATSALKWTTDHVAPAEAEAQRLVSILEALGIDLDEETLVTLELIGKDDSYKEARRDIRNAVNRSVSDTQWCERDYEHDRATDALIDAGFIHIEDEDYFDRDAQRVTVTLANGREARYEWELQDNASGEQVTVDSGKSGSFSRLIALIQKKEVMQ